MHLAGSDIKERPYGETRQRWPSIRWMKETGAKCGPGSRISCLSIIVMIPGNILRDKVTDADTFVRHTSALAEPPPVRDA